MDDFDVDLDFELDTSNILQDYSTEDLIEELKRRGLEVLNIRPYKGLNINKSNGGMAVVIWRKPAE